MSFKSVEPVYGDVGEGGSIEGLVEGPPKVWLSTDFVVKEEGINQRSIPSAVIV